MSWVEEIGLDEATEPPREELERPVRRAGRVWNIVQVMSLNPGVMRKSMELYGELMLGASSPLSRIQRETLATICSVAVKCRY